MIRKREKERKKVKKSQSVRERKRDENMSEKESVWLGRIDKIKRG